MTNNDNDALGLKYWEGGIETLLREIVRLTYFRDTADFKWYCCRYLNNLSLFNTN